MGERYYINFLLARAEITLNDRAIVISAANSELTSANIIRALRRVCNMCTENVEVPVEKSKHAKPVVPWNQTTGTSSTANKAMNSSFRDDTPRKAWVPKRNHRGPHRQVHTAKNSTNTTLLEPFGVPL